MEKKVDFWQSIVQFISNQCKVNKGLVAAVAHKLVVTNMPDQNYCNIHPILMLDEKFKKMWQNFEEQISAEKLFLLINYANLDEEMFVVAVFGCNDGMHITW